MTIFPIDRWITFARPAVALGLAVALFYPASSWAQRAPSQGTPATAQESFQPQSGQLGKDVVWVPTPDAVVEAMLDMAEVTEGDKVVDLGAGDGRIAIAAARRGAHSLGIEYNEDMVALSRRNAARAGAHNAKFVQGDIFESDFSDADVVTLYLLPELNERLRPTLLDMKPGTRVVSHQFTMGSWKPDAKRTIGGSDALFWIVPANVAGTWQVGQLDGDLQLELEQEYQELQARGRWGSEDARVRNVKLTGADIRFTVTDRSGDVHHFVGVADHDGRMTGTVTDGNGDQRPFTARRTSAVEG
ncbi:MAG: methyltransferase domain-containing protein [Xanthomonadales bacterium]|nr:methyltransferase domain-containing protein [Xanthomonadales bacterium]ODU92936.1 MAG: hypothetical protein ABT18_10640 [Rhodanobacter sp. SCN 66-43]OJY83726.1 MAG: hypothetical protein BGP23_13865 [Xanthomonadales bacterium 66-474]